eukprot:TRINITY_DN51449_c0_g1_i1.p1 TRINITY_DN51449_c0_g1~~TRINITY_DN51449_c0_g1_i1.p1  ORF type:complete len:408 (+),score=108.45 TRINITY_DN51449_c0_g1_i1:38-1225(+)
MIAAVNDRSGTAATTVAAVAKTTAATMNSGEPLSNRVFPPKMPESLQRALNRPRRRSKPRSSQVSPATLRARNRAIDDIFNHMPRQAVKRLIVVTAVVQLAAAVYNAVMTKMVYGVATTVTECRTTRAAMLSQLALQFIVTLVRVSAFGLVRMRKKLWSVVSALVVAFTLAFVVAVPLASSDRPGKCDSKAAVIASVILVPVVFLVFCIRRLFILYRVHRSPFVVLMGLSVSATVIAIVSVLSMRRADMSANAFVTARDSVRLVDSFLSIMVASYLLRQMWVLHISHMERSKSSRYNARAAAGIPSARLPSSRQPSQRALVGGRRFSGAGRTAAVAPANHRGIADRTTGGVDSHQHTAPKSFDTTATQESGNRSPHSAAPKRRSSLQYGVKRQIH